LSRRLADNRPVIPPPLAWFLRLWAIAVLAHIAGNPPGWKGAPVGTALGTASALLGVLALAVLLRPGRWTGAALGAATIMSVVLEAPVLGNHWLVAGLVSILLVASLFRRDPWAAFAPGARGILIAFYSFAAFAKLNRGFFDPTVSCGITYTNQLLGSYGLPLIPDGDWRAVAVAAATALIELSVPVLLVMKRTRRYGVLLGFVFHLFISFDLDQHFYDFSALLVALFSLFLADEVLKKFPDPLAMRRSTQVAVGGILALFALAAVVPPSPLTDRLLGTGVFFLWIPWGLFLIARLWRLVRGPGAGQAEWGRLGWVGGLLVAVTVLNGLTPYLELKTGYGFNMYANLVTADGRSNHYLLPRTIPLTDAQRDPYIVLTSDDPGLHHYVDSGWAITEPQLRDYLADHPTASATVIRVLGGEQQVVTGADGVALPWWRDKFQLFRAIDLNDPPRCQLVWMPAR
jgi:Vitamin K-dependent gamma-carboxylase